MSTKTKGIVAAAVLAAVIAMASFRITRAQVGMGKLKTVTYVLEGNYRVHLDLAFIDNTGEKGQEELIKKIEFHPEYVVLMDQHGGGRVVPVHAIKNLKWEQS